MKAKEAPWWLVFLVGLVWGVVLVSLWHLYSFDVLECYPSSAG